jgi:beta-glucanase (GH16 family)
MRPNRLFALILALHLPSASFGKEPAARSLLPGGPDKWQLAWSDEFDYPDAKLDEKWESQNGPSGHILCSRWRENARVDGGTLKLINRKEKRGGQEWTSGSIWTKEQFLYGYFECRYKYAAAPGTNNSFWLMTRGPEPSKGKRFEIDINEGHFPNEVNTNIHNWSDVKVVNGRKTHPSSSKSFPFGVRPDRVIQLEIPVTAKRIRFSSNHKSQFHIGEFRIYNVNPAGYPDPLSNTAEKDKPGLVNFARDPETKVAVSGHFEPAKRESITNLTDGNARSSWISQKDGRKWIEFKFAGEKTIGCIQFVNGWKDSHGWRGLLENYTVQYHDGRRWVDMAAFDLAGGEVNFARDFHTYGLEWNEKELVFYFDGKEIRREKNGFCFSPSPVWLSLAIIPWAGTVTKAIDGTRMEVDYVRVYKPAGEPANH